MMEAGFSLGRENPCFSAVKATSTAARFSPGKLRAIDIEVFLPSSQLPSCCTPREWTECPVVCLRAFRREPTPSFPLADDRWVSRRTAREGAVGGIRGWDSDPFLKCICACQLHEQFENHGLIYLIQYVGLKCDTFLFLFEPF